MLEAKGATGWANSQLSAKVKRLKAVLDCDVGGQRIKSGVAFTMHFLLDLVLHKLSDDCFQ